MHLVDFETFNKLPAGTIFMPYDLCTLKEGFAIKTDRGHVNSYGHCFNGAMPLEPSNLDYVYDNEPVKATFDIFDNDSNDYRNYKRFLIFDDFDIDRLINVLRWAKDGCPDVGYEAFDEE